MIVTTTGLNFTPFISSWKNLINPAPVAGITPSSRLLDLLDDIFACPPDNFPSD
jgi:hypothetical protein